MSTPQIVFNINAPATIFQDSDQKVIDPLDLFKQLTGGGANQEILAAITGKKIRVLEMVVSSGSTASVLSIKSASAGTILRLFQIPAITQGDPNVVLPYDADGHFDTIVGQGLFADVAAGPNVNFSMRYIPFTPAS